jgi:hypothetical protein|tara:strand:+ start:29 stop:505 length:477 start_codon:yes stop_codon:yes gene_type:complete
MANGFKVFSTGEVLTAADVNDYLMEQSIGIFASSTTRDSQISSPIEGQFAYLSDSNTLTYYTGSSWASYIGDGDITAVTITTSATSGLSGGTTAASGAFSSTLTVNPTQLTDGTGITVDNSNDLLILYDTNTTTTKKINPSQLSTGGGASAGLILTLG